MVVSHRISAALVAALAVGCAGSGDLVSTELSRAALRADGGVQKIRASLADLDQTARGFGEGVRQVELATRDLAALETDERATEIERLQAVILQARAWDDAAHAIEDAADPDKSRPALTAALRDKSFPARIAARNAFERSLRSACAVTGEDPAVVLELLDGIARYGGEVIAPDQACP